MRLFCHSRYMGTEAQLIEDSAKSIKVGFDFLAG